MNKKLVPSSNKIARYAQEQRVSKLVVAADTLLWAPNGYHPVRVDEKVPQIHGVDWIDAIRGWKIDDKNKVAHPDGRPLGDKFGLEVFSANNPDGIGWLFQPESWTTHYAFVYGMAGTLDWSFFTELNAVLVDKNDILDYLTNKGMPSYESVINLFDEYAMEVYRGRHCFYELEFSGLLLSQNADSIEHPLNIQIPLDEVKKIATDIIQWHA